MRRIQEVALDRFDKRGFEDVTIEQIAEAAEVSPNSVYRWFGTKKQVVLRHEFEPEFFDLVESGARFAPACEGAKTGDLAGDDRLLPPRRRPLAAQNSLFARGAQPTSRICRAGAASIRSSRARNRDCCSLPSSGVG